MNLSLNSAANIASLPGCTGLLGGGVDEESDKGGCKEVGVVVCKGIGKLIGLGEIFSLALISSFSSLGGGTSLVCCLADGVNLNLFLISANIASLPDSTGRGAA